MSDFEIDFNLEMIGDIIGGIPDSDNGAAANSKPSTYRKEVVKTVSDEEEEEMMNRIKTLIKESKELVPRYFKNVSYNANSVEVKEMILLVEGTTFVTIPLDNAKRPMYKPTFYLEQGDTYQFRIDFELLRKMPVDLKYQQTVYRYGYPVNTNQYRIKAQNLPTKIVQSMYTTEEMAPLDKLHEGLYTVKSLFTDVAMNKYKEWEWCFWIGPKKDEY